MSLIPLLFSLWMTTADAHLSAGLHLAERAHYQQAEELLVAGRKIAPFDVRFSQELAGLAYRRKDFDTARSHLHDALAADPGDSYTNNFLATLYYLQGNQEAAVKYWNRAGKPTIDEVHTSETLQTDPVLLDRAFAAAPAELLTYDDYVTTHERLSMLGVFRNIRLELTPEMELEFDLEFKGVEKNGIGNNKLQSLISVLRQAHESTVHFDFFNLRGSTKNVESLLRWNSRRQRASFSLSAPQGAVPTTRWSINLDYRNEDWLLPPESSPMTMRLFQVSIELKALTRNHWILGSAFELSNSNFPVPPAGRNDILFGEGYSLKYSGTLQRTLLRIPEKRARLDFSGSVGLGKQLGPDDYYGSFDSGILLEWYPHARGVNHKTAIQFRTGALWGGVPFYEYFVMGREQDSDLLLRAHVPSYSEPKGENPIARSYVLCNFEMDQMLYSNGLFELALTPFLDTGKGYDSSGQFGSSGWLADAGVQSKLNFMRLLEMKFSFGKNLRNGKGAFYFEISPF